jgi:hypothetical protein
MLTHKIFVLKAAGNLHFSGGGRALTKLMNHHDIQRQKIPLNSSLNVDKLHFQNIFTYNLIFEGKN